MIHGRIAPAEVVMVADGSVERRKLIGSMRSNGTLARSGAEAEGLLMKVRARFRVQTPSPCQRRRPRSGANPRSARPGVSS